MTDQIKHDINALVEPPRQSRSLPPVEPVGGYPAGRGVAAYQSGGGSGGAGGGIASPLTEEDAGERTYHNSNVLMSMSYLIGLQVKPLESIKMTDANGSPVTMIYDLPDYD